jgi:taurine dioxygenase
MEINPVGEMLGAEIKGVDLLAATDPEIEAIYAALLEHEVLFFRDTGLDDASHLALAARFGRPSVFPLARIMGQNEPTFQTITDGPESQPATDYWHTDVTWTEEPPRAAFLRATIVPKSGGDTRWASMTAAYQGLSPKMRGFLDGLRVHHDNESFIEGMVTKMGEDATRPLADALRHRYPGVEHPLVRTHPETGRRALLWGGHFMRFIVDLDEPESRAILVFLAEHIDRPEYHLRWSWKPGDLAIWDERSTVHRGCSDHYPQAREVRRCVIDGDRPYF